MNSLGYEYVYLNTLGMNEEEIKKINIDQIIKERTSFWSKKKSFVLLVDDTQSLPKIIADSIKRNFDNKLINSVVLASETVRLSSLNENLLGLIGERVVKMRPMTNDEALGMIINRIKHINPFDPGSLDIVFERAGLIPRNILSLCEYVARKSKEKIIKKDSVIAIFEEKERVKPKSIFENLSPLQKKIVMILKTGDYRPVDIARKLDKPPKTITSQLAYLSLKAGVDIMKRKGLEEPLVERISKRPTLYRLKDDIVDEV